MAIIRTTLLFDEDLLSRNAAGSTAANPKQGLPANSLVMVSEGQDGLISGGAELGIQARLDDELHWHASAMSPSSTMNVMIYGMFINATGNGYLKAPSVTPNTDYNRPFPSTDVTSSPDANGTWYTTQPSAFTRVSGAASYWETKVIKAPHRGHSVYSVAYTFRVVLFDDDNSPIGFFAWDPYINILPHG